MKNSLLVKLGAAGIALALVGCQAERHASVSSEQLALRTAVPADSAIVEEKAHAIVHPKEHYYLGQVQVLLNSEDDLASVVSDLQTKEGVELSVLDKIPDRAIYLMKVESDSPVSDVIQNLKKDSRVLAAGKNNHMSADQTTAPSIPPKYRSNDPLISTQWALSNVGQEAPAALAGKANADISMVRDSAGSKEVVVAIIDTGLDYHHEDLAETDLIDGKPVINAEKSNIWINPEEKLNGINDDNNGDRKNRVGYVDDIHGYNFVGRNGDPMDDHGHGTHVAGVIGALRNNHIGIAGMNEKVSIMGLKFLSAEGGGSDFDAQAALYYVIDMKRRFPKKKYITSNSWGSQGRESKNGDEDDFLLGAFRAAEKAGILTIAAAGNDGTSNRFDEHYPSNYSNKMTHFISVAATNNSDQLASFSSYGYDNVQVAAPGVLIMSTVPKKLFGHGYEAWSGTSMATPHVTGLAALIWGVGSSRVDLQACKLEYSIVSPK